MADVKIVPGPPPDDHVFVAPPAAGTAAYDAASREAVAESLLRHHAALFRTTISSLSVGVTLIGRDGAILVCNRAAHEILGITEREFLDRNATDAVWDVLNEDGSACPPDQLPVRRAVFEKRPVRGVIGVRRPPPLERVWIMVDAVPQFDERGEVRHLITSYTDVTAHRAATEALRASEEQLRHAQKMDAVGRLAGAVAHDFNNLLTAILGYADLLVRDMPENDPRQREAEEIRRAAQRASALTRQLLAFSRKQILAPRVLDPRQLVNDMRPMLRRLVREDIALEVELAADTPRVCADAAHLEQVVVNLVVNARDAMPQGGRLTLTTRAERLAASDAERLAVTPGEYAVLSVADTGHGMDERTLGQIFEPFFTTKGQEQGTGLGLTTVYGIVRQSGGTIRVDSEPGRGSTFEVLIPATLAPIESPADPPAGAASRGNEIVLLVEDESAVRRLAFEILAGAGYHVLSAEDPESALRLAAAHGRDIDILVTDVVMPGMNGRQLHDALRRTRPHLRTLFISGYPDDAALTDGSAGPGAVLAKPFSSSELLARVRATLEAPANGA
jgi:PAS domain S-box-containing protein